MRILYFTQYFPPEVGATQTRAWEMSRYLASRGHSVTVVTEVPNHPSGIVPQHYKGKLWERCTEEGVDVLRLWVYTSPRKSFRTRMAFYLSYMSMAALVGSLLRGRYDVVYATSPPLFVAPAGLVAAMVRRVPFVLEVRDLWPESAVALGELANPPAIRAAERLEQILYRRAGRIVAVTRGIHDRLLQRGISEDKLALIPNGANTDLFSFDPEGRERIRGELGLHDKFVAMYAGIHGVAQGLETLLRAAETLRERPEVIFIFVGEGPKKAEMLALREAMGLPNVRLLPELPAASMRVYLSAADCAIVPLRDEAVFRGALPSKMFEAWACERPVLLSVAGEAETVLREAAGGVAVLPEKPQAMAEALLWLQAHPDERAEMGSRGRAFVVGRYTRREQARKLEALLLEVVREARGNKKARGTRRPRSSK